MNPEILRLGKSKIATLPGAGRVAQALPPSTRRHPAPRSAHARHGEGEALVAPVRAHERRRRRRRIPSSPMPTFPGRRSSCRPARRSRLDASGVHQVPRAAEPRRPQAGDGRLLRAPSRPTSARIGVTLYSQLKAGRGVRQGAQVSGFDHARARRATDCRSRCSTR